MAIVLGALLALPAIATPAGAEGPVIEAVVVERDADGRLTVRTELVPADPRTPGRPAPGIVIAASAGRTVVSVEPQIEVHAFAPATDQRRPSQWALDRVAFETAWDSFPGTQPGDGITVAVLDTGVRASHEDLVGVLGPGTDFVTPGGDGTLADHAHGSHVSGIIAAQENNTVGIAGAAPGARLLPVRVLNQHGSGTVSGVANGIIWAVDNGADIINLSLGTTSDSQTLRAAVNYAEANGTLIVAAAGNDGAGFNDPTYPAAIDEVIGVSATTAADTLASYSNHGAWIDIAAPGSGILSLAHYSNTSYSSMSGTSMASPYVAAAAVLIRDADPTLTPAEVRGVLYATAEDLGPSGKDNSFGAGLIDPVAALDAVIDQPEPEQRVNPDADPLPEVDATYTMYTSLGRTLNPAVAAAANAPAVASSSDPIVGAASGANGATWFVTGSGEVRTAGGAAFHGDLSGVALNQPIVGIAATPTGAGYWLVATDGGIFTFGDATYLGSTGDIALNQPIVGMASTPTGNGYWLVATDGGIFTFGDATFHGSTGNIVLNQPIVGMASTPTGNGYWLVATDGGIFTFGDATFLGSTGNIVLNEPVMAMAATPSGSGYWLVASDGGIFTFGDATFLGSAAGLLAPGEYIVAVSTEETS